MRIISTLIIAVIPIICLSQSEFKAGFIVKNTGDTLKGYLKEDIENNLQKGVVFKQSNSDAEKLLGGNDIKAFGFDGGNIFEKISYSDPSENTRNEQFAKLMLKGYYHLFSFMKSDRQYYLVRTTEDSMYVLRDVYATITGVIKEESNYKNILLFLSRDCKAQKDRLDNLSYTDKDILNYIVALNNCLAPSASNDVVYKKEKSKMNIYAYAGGIALSNRYEITGRIMASFTMPGLDRKTSFNVGLNFMRHSEKQDVDMSNVVLNGYKEQIEKTLDVFSVPFFVQYHLTKGFIQPYVNGGASLDYLKEVDDEKISGPVTKNKAGFGLLTGGGVDGNISKNLAIRAEWLVEYIFTYDFIPHYPTIGVVYTFKK